MRFCQEGVDDNEKEFFNETERFNNYKTKADGKKNNYRNGTMSFLGLKKTDSKKKKEDEKILDEFVLDSFLLDDV